MEANEQDLPAHVKDVIASARRVIAGGGTVWFKWTCAGCGSRQTFETENKLYLRGTCEECGNDTDVTRPAAELNFMAALTNGG